ncbi:hypothetical protein SAMN04487949_3050 [Halogranum gelatinilyticum]|uniref:SnoaL-like domain-containing protein n=1 Tax=Halogranum gelatinilyticum TaxID=660521 RepID=A0A1G9XM27_9EURY|nr:nuclear transport factor 2 family protein [Halogranum gelatinilyticum]SDM97892.1 hypothetical protein SAMN04487949_3050 [Halogranum gelatinilyticum]
MATTTTDNVATVSALYDAFNRGDIDTVLAGMDPDVTWIEPRGDPLSGGRYRSPAAVVSQVFAPLKAAYRRFEVRPGRFVDGGETVVVEGMFVGTTAAGTTFEIPFAHVCDLHDGLVLQFTNHTDTAEFLRVLSR